MGISFPKGNMDRLRESVSSEKTSYNLGEEHGRAAAWREEIVNRRNEEGLKQGQRRERSFRWSNHDCAIRRFHLAALEQGDGAVVIRSARIRMKCLVQ